MIKIKNLRDLIEEQKDKGATLQTEIEALQLGTAQQEDKVWTNEHTVFDKIKLAVGIFN